MKALYNFGISSYSAVIKLAGLLGNKKAQKWTNGRKNWRGLLQQKLSNNPSKIIWIHATSLGEFDQAKPLIEKIKEDPFLTNYKILATFFSPSGYEYSKNYPLIDYAFYLPSDTKKNALDFINFTKPSIAIFVKYDFWFNYLSTLQKKSIPTLFFSSNFRKNQIYFRKGNDWQLDILKKINSILTINEESKMLLEKYNFNHTEVCGDTRFDKVIQNAKRCQPFELIEKFKLDKKLLILGSSWEKEENALLNFIQNVPNWNEKLKIIVAPHNIYEDHVKEIEKKLPVKTLKYSYADINNISDFDVLIIDNIGMLSNLYQYSDISFIGGGFTNRLHNILEAATFGNAVLYGNNHSKFPEAKQLYNFGGGIELNHENDFAEKINLLLADNEHLESIKKKAKEFIEKNVGATEVVFTKVKQLINASDK